jgi:hypothetical protein
MDRYALGVGCWALGVGRWVLSFLFAQIGRSTGLDGVGCTFRWRMRVEQTSFFVPGCWVRYIYAS